MEGENLVCFKGGLNMDFQVKKSSVLIFAITNTLQVCYFYPEE